MSKVFSEIDPEKLFSLKIIEIDKDYDSIEACVSQISFYGKICHYTYNSKDLYRSTPLTIAVIDNDQRLLEILIEYNILNPNKEVDDPRDNLPKKEVDIFLENVDDINLLTKTVSKDSMHFNQLMYGFLRHDLIDLIIYAEGVKPMEKSFNAMPIEYLAVKHDSPYTFNYLIDNYKRINLTLWGWSLLGYAIDNKRMPMIITLIEHPGIYINQIFKNGWTALNWAIKKNDLETVDLLLNHENINPNIQTFKKYPIEFAIEKENHDIIRSLLSKNVILNYVIKKSLKRSFPEILDEFNIDFE